MPVPRAHRAACAALLPGESIAYLFPASSGYGEMTSSFYVAVTDRSISLIAVSMVRGRPTAVYARYRRDTKLGPLDTSFGPTCRLGPWVLELPDEYAAQVLAADAEITAPDFPDDRF